MAIKGAKNRAITEKSKDVKQKDFMFPGNPPVTVKAKTYKEALEKFEKLQVKTK